MKLLSENEKDTNEIQLYLNKTHLQNTIIDEDKKYDFAVLDFMKLKKSELSSLVTFIFFKLIKKNKMIFNTFSQKLGSDITYTKLRDVNVENVE